MDPAIRPIIQESYWQLGCDAAKAGLPLIFPYPQPHVHTAPNFFPTTQAFNQARWGWISRWTYGRSLLATNRKDLS